MVDGKWSMRPKMERAILRRLTDVYLLNTDGAHNKCGVKEFNPSTSIFLKTYFKVTYILLCI